MKNVRAVEFANQDKLSIDLLVDHPVFGDIPFTASRDDAEAHGRDLLARAVAGEFGPVAEYAGPSLAQLAAEKNVARIAGNLHALDLRSIRALRAKAAGRGGAGDDAKLAKLDDEAAALRAELVALKV